MYDIAGELEKAGANCKVVNEDPVMKRSFVGVEDLEYETFDSYINTLPMPISQSQD